MPRAPIHRRILLATILFCFALSGYVLVHAQPVSTPPSVPETLHCLGNNSGFSCEMTHFETMTRVRGPKAAMENLKQEYAKRADIVSNCHQLAHVIGNAASEMYDGNIALAFTQGDSFCWSGYYHGVVERAVKDSGEAAVINNLDQLCSAITGKERYSFDYYNCVHGLGHGIMAVKDDEVFASLPICDKLTGEWERKSCYGGVFMENIMTDNRTHFSKDLKKDDLMYPCDAVDTQYKEQCYLMQTSYALSESNYDFKSIFKLCANVEAPFRDTCAQSMGRDASGLSVSNIERTIASCALAENDTQEKNCVIGAVKDFISYFHGDAEAAAFCNALPSRFQNDCNTTRISYEKTL